MSWPVAVSSFGPVEAGAMLWAHEGALRVTLVLRTAFGLVPGPLTQAAPGVVERVEAHYRSDPAKPVRTPADLAPRVPRAEIIHAGAVIAPAGVTMVRLALLRDGKTLFEKRGVASAKSDSPGLGPLGPGSPARHALLKGLPEPRPDANGAVVVANGFDFSFYQCAPADQRVDAVLGGDQILVGNLHPDVPELSVLVPNRAPVARAMLGRQEAPLPLACKRILLDTDRRVYTLVWYGEMEIPGLAAVPHLRIEARAPELVTAPVTSGSPAGAPVTSGAPRADAHAMLQRIAVAPTVAVRAVHSGAPATPPRVTNAGTVVIEGGPGNAPAPPPVAPPAPVPFHAEAAPRGRLDSTLALDVEGAPDAGPAALPFAGAARPNASPAEARGNVATPWSAAPLKPAPKPANKLAGTVALDGPDEEPPRLPPPPAPPPPAIAHEEPAPPPSPPPPVAEAARAPSVVETPATRASPWAPQAAEPAPPVAPPPVARPKGPAAAMASLKKDGNDRFKKR